MGKVSERALIQRINRRIGGVANRTAWGERLRKNSSDRWYGDLGCYYTVDLISNAVTCRLGNLEQLEQYGREIGALTTSEEVAT
jgi:hypothetical protein